jgi:tRNA-specific 2-thiouridylase
VAHKDLASNTLWVVQGHDHPWLLSEHLQAQDISWVAGRPPSGLQSSRPAVSTLAAKTRYRQADAACQLSLGLGADGQTCMNLAFEQAQWAVTPGQSAVLYDGEVCLGGGVITAGPAPALPSLPMAVKARPRKPAALAKA